MQRVLVQTFFIAAALVCAPIHQAAAEGGIQVGLLTCSVVPGTRVNLLVRSTADIECEFSNNGVIEKYQGETGIALGLDLSFRRNEKIAFAVFAASQDVTPGAKALGGKFIGGQVSAAAGIGLGARALIGGGEKNVGLQPLALETSTGIGVAGGLSFLYLEPK